HGLEVFLEVTVGREGIGHLAFDDRDAGIANPYLVAGVDNCAISDGRSIGQVVRGDVRIISHRGVVGGYGVGNKRQKTAGGVAAARGVLLERASADGRVVDAVAG